MENETVSLIESQSFEQMSDADSDRDAVKKTDVDQV